MGWTTPPTESTGYVVTATDWYNYISANPIFLYGDTAWTAVASFSNSWVNFGAPETAAGYRLVGNTVTLRGCVKSGTIGLTIFTLPVGYRPSNTRQFAVVSNALFGSVQISAAGAVGAATGSNVSFFLDGITFDVLA